MVYMRKSLALTFAIIFLLSATLSTIQPTSSSAPKEDSWTTKSPMHEARGGLGVAVVNDKIYAIGGYNGSGPYLATNEEYDPATDTWTLKTPLPTPMAYFGIAVYQDKIYCISGETGATQVYSPQTDTWETRASLPNPRDGITANTVAGKIYVVGGKSDITEVYDPVNDVWTTKAAVPVTPDLQWGWSCASVVFDNEIHVIGVFPLSNSCQIYNPFNDSWRFGTPLMAGVYFGSAGATAGVDKRIYVFGGDRRFWDNGEIYVLTQIYDPKNCSWTKGESMPTGRLEAGVAVVDGLVYVIGGLVPWLGSNWSASAANEQYTPICYATPTPSYGSPTVSPSDQSPASSQLTQSPQSTAFQELLFVIAGIIAATIIIAAATLTLKRKQQKILTHAFL